MVAIVRARPKADRRIAFALTMSLAVHGVLLALIGPQSGGAGSVLSAPLQAQLEAMRSDLAGQLPDATVPTLIQQNGNEVAAEPASGAESAPTRTHAPSPEAPSAGATPGNDGPPEVPIALAPDLTYYPVSMLDSPPRLLGSADECYPPGASGEVAYLLLIDETGTVDEASMLEFSASPSQAAGVIESCRALKFVPATKDGWPVRSRVRFVIGANPS